MPKLPLPFNLPLRVRGRKGVTCIIFITPLPPLNLKRGILGKLMEAKCSSGKTV
jgi:hypothetical protein